MRASARPQGGPPRPSSGPPGTRLTRAACVLARSESKLAVSSAIYARVEIWPACITTLIRNTQCKKWPALFEESVSHVRRASMGSGISHFIGTASRLRGAGAYHQEAAARLWRTRPNNQGPKRALRGPGRASKSSESEDARAPFRVT